MTSLDRWKGKVALVTGASSGIGQATARLLADAGMRVAAAARSLERLEALQRAQQETSSPDQISGEILPIQTDLRDENQIEALFDHVRQKWGGVDVLINNAGLGYAGSLSDQSSTDWREMLDVNVLALSRCTQEALKDMETCQEGYIIHISSITAHTVIPSSNPFYGATKHAVRALSESLRQELVARKSPVRISSISPGLVETEFSARSRRTPGFTANYQNFKVIQPEDIAQAVAYLLSTPHHIQVNDIILRPRLQEN